MKINAKHYGFNPTNRVVLYYKAGEWRIYEESSYPKRYADDDLIQEVMQEKRVKRQNVKFGIVKTLDIEVLKDENSLNPKSMYDTYVGDYAHDPKVNKVIRQFFDAAESNGFKFSDVHLPNKKGHFVTVDGSSTCLKTWSEEVSLSLEVRK